MVDTLIGISTYGGIEFSRLAIQSVRETIKEFPYQIYCVVGKSDDVESIKYFDSENIPYSYHEWNKGFPVAINDIYDFGWKTNHFDNIIIMGNDVCPYDYAIDSMIEVARTTDYEWICANQYDVKSLCNDYPEARKYFSGQNYIFDFSGEPWKLVTNFSKDIIIAGPGMSDVQNLCLYKKSVFDKIGYTDANYWPCLDPDTLILNDKLIWIPIGELNPGDGIVGVDEYPERPGASRSYRKAIIEAKRELKASCVKITLSDGRSVICSEDHRWLIKRPIAECYFWRKASELSVGERMCAPLKTWEYNPTYDVGWLAGIYDGEGCINKASTHCNVNFYQKKGKVLDKGMQILTSMSIPFHYYDRQSSTACVVEVSERQFVLELLGRLQPTRLNRQDVWDGLRIRSKNKAISIESIEPVGVRDVVDIQVSTRAFLANGMVTHNCYYIDNDLARRGVNAGIKSCTLPNSVYFHFWSRVIHQGSGGSTHRAFENNRRYYKLKWNGDFGQERFRVPFNGFDFQLAPDIILRGDLKIDSRENEEKIARYWSSKL